MLQLRTGKGLLPRRTDTLILGSAFRETIRPITERNKTSTLDNPQRLKIASL
jgi:hypothetical protein